MPDTPVAEATVVDWTPDPCVIPAERMTNPVSELDVKLEVASFM